MKVLIYFGVLLLNQQQIAAWIGLIEYSPQEFTKHGVENTHCFTTSEKLGRFDRGDVKRLDGQCAIAECLENRSIKLTGCAPIMVKPPCYVGPGDISKPFPGCCFEIVCPEEKDVKNEID